jgi:hypothetical protein
VSDDRKAFARITGAGRFDRSIERQQIDGRERAELMP